MKKISRILSSIFLVMYISYLLNLVFFSTHYGRGYFHRSYNFIPFKTIVEYIFFSHNLNATFVNIAGNILAFVPMGFLTPIAFNRINKFKDIAILSLIATISIEIIQCIIGVGTCDIDDVILNWIGGIIGFHIYIVILKKIKNNPY
ncbi:VanZ family protein [Tepidibacter aestuarii]|uniref:VanZ family protein n=1 Tax=Tepidibacter aestuarii TaxID=2925782 RepID=UPI0020BE685F|nr:VanZ family protein [Tepidibacter aestuarii]CAH2212484.1 Glycopeptide antibiotics resistance protein [Tepidibacter aestuarii]